MSLGYLAIIFGFIGAFMLFLVVADVIFEKLLENPKRFRRLREFFNLDEDLQEDEV